MKRLLYACILSAAALQAATAPKSPNKEPPAYDADLFRKDEQVFSFHGEFLFWRVQEAALDYALKMKHDAWGPAPSYAQGDFKKASFNGDPGFRVAASFYRAPKYWDMKWQYTRLTASGSDSAGKPHPDGEYLTGTWPQITSNPLSGAKSHIHMNYNVFDYLVDRVFNPNPHLRLKFGGGGSVAWINQDWKVRYYDSTGESTTIRNRWKFIGGGLRIGTTIDWFFGYDIYLTALASTGLYLGSYHNKATQKSTFPAPAGSNNAIPVRDAKFSDVRPSATIQGAFGPSWQKNFTSSRVEVFAGYEINGWFNLQEVYRSTSGGPFDAKETWINNGMIALQGLTTRLTVDF